MGTFSIWHWLIVLVIVLLLFGANKIPRLAGDMAKGIKAFKKGLQEEDKEDGAAPPKAIEGEPVRKTAEATGEKDASKG